MSGDQSPLRVALAGNPNAGKTSIFNALTGAHQRVGNYSGVTVERRQGRYQDGELRVEVTDLPGTYSLSSFSPEEWVAQQELLWGSPEVVVVVADATNLSRSLVILAQIMRLRVRLVLCLNFFDEAEAAGQRLDREQLERLLGFEVVETVGHRGGGLEQLRRAITASARAPLPRRSLLQGRPARRGPDRDRRPARSDRHR